LDVRLRAAAAAPPKSRTIRRGRYPDRAFELCRQPGGVAMDLGCGTGRHGTAMLVERGFTVTGVDVSPKSIDAARREGVGATFMMCDMAVADFPRESVELVTAFYSIIHLPKEEHGAVLSRAASWLRSGGFLIAVMGAGSEAGDSVDPAWFGEAPMFGATGT